MAVGIHPGAVKTEMAEENAPEEFKKFRYSSYNGRGFGVDQCPDLTDSVDLCGGYCVWLTAQAEKKLWLTGRFIAATWDADQLVERKEEIEEKDLLKAKMAIH